MHIIELLKIPQMSMEFWKNTHFSKKCNWSICCLTSYKTCMLFKVDDVERDVRLESQTLCWLVWSVSVPCLLDKASILLVATWNLQDICDIHAQCKKLTCFKFNIKTGTVYSFIFAYLFMLFQANIFLSFYFSATNGSIHSEFLLHCTLFYHFLARTNSTYKA